MHEIEAVAPTGASKQAKWENVSVEPRPRTAAASTPPSSNDRVELSALAQQVVDHETVQLQLDPRVLAALITRDEPAVSAPAPAVTAAAPTSGAPTTVKGL